jgi:hypothetical protein
MKFGEILSKIENKLVGSYVNESFKTEMNNFKKFVLENKEVSSVFHLYTQLSSNQGLDKDVADLYITESLRQIEKNLSNLDLSKVTKWVKDVVCENQYQDIDNMVYSHPNTILESVSSRKNVINKLTEKKQVQESINLPIESIFKIAGKQVEKYIENLDESSKKDLSKVLMTEDTELSKEYTDLKTKTIDALSNITSVEDELTKNKLTETIQQIESEEYSKINYVRLYSLYNNIQ